MSMVPIVLLVEDDEGVVDSYRRTFEADDIVLDVAETWDEALALFRVVAHRLVIADYNLPGDEHGLKLLIQMKLLVPSTELILISGALSRPAEELARKVELIDHFYAKTSTLPDTLVEHAKAALARADDQTDWQRVGQKYLTPADAVNSQLAEIDDALRADVAKRRRRD
jgi:DNA-binding NtrC family response regulator